MAKFLPILVVIGIFVGFISSSLSHLLPKSDTSSNNDTNLGIALLFYGVGNIVGGYLGGMACDKLNNFAKVATVGVLIGIFSEFLKSYFLYTEFYSIISTSVVAFCMSLSLSYLMCYGMVVCTIFYQGKT